MSIYICPSMTDQCTSPTECGVLGCWRTQSAINAAEQEYSSWFPIKSRFYFQRLSETQMHSCSFGGTGRRHESHAESQPATSSQWDHSETGNGEQR